MGEYLDVKTAASLSGLSVAWWRMKIFLRQVPFHKVFGKILIARKDLENLLAASRVEPKASTPITRVQGSEISARGGSESKVVRHGRNGGR